MGCGATAQSKGTTPVAPEADVRGFSRPQLEVLEQSITTSRALADQIRAHKEALQADGCESNASCHSPTCSMTSQAAWVDFDEEGRKLMQEGKIERLSLVWVHPISNARLYVGTLEAAQSREVLESKDITHLVRCLDADGTPGDFEGEEEFCYLHYPIAWWRTPGIHRSDKGMARLSAPLLGFVSSALESEHNVLIHCLAGAHRAGTASVACLMHLATLDAPSALCAAKAARDAIDPIGHLRVFLRKLEKAAVAGALKVAIEDAAKKGHEQAVYDIFSCCADFQRVELTK